jgi:hypothetical protein
MIAPTLAFVIQWIECLSSKQNVLSSILSEGTNNMKILLQFIAFIFELWFIYMFGVLLGMLFTIVVLGVAFISLVYLFAHC